MKDPVVTKSILKSTLDKVLSKALSKALQKQKEEIIKETAEFFQTSIFPTLDELNNKLDDLTSFSGDNERRLDKHDNKIMDLEHRTTSLEQRIPLPA